MDYEFYDETKTRFQVQSGPLPDESEDESGDVDKVHALVCCSFGVAFLAFLWTWSLPPFLHLFLLWIALSLLLGPFAPLSFTAGDCRVGQGERLPVLEDPPPLQETPETDSSRVSDSIDRKRSKSDRVSKRGGEPGIAEIPPALAIEEKKKMTEISNGISNGFSGAIRDDEWEASEVELLRKQIVKHPRGKLRRWEFIAEAFGGSRTVEDVIKKAKFFSEKPQGNDSFSKFLSQRKTSEKSIASPLDFDEEPWSSPADDGDGDQNPAKTSNGDLRSKVEDKRQVWSETEDRALLTALKAFPKEAPMRWDKITSAITGRSKPQCMKRYSELKESFRNSKSDGKQESEL